MSCLSVAPNGCSGVITWSPMHVAAVEGVKSKSRTAQDPKEAQPVAARVNLVSREDPATEMGAAGLAGSSKVVSGASGSLSRPGVAARLQTYRLNCGKTPNRGEKLL